MCPLFSAIFHGLPTSATFFRGSFFSFCCPRVFIAVDRHRSIHLHRLRMQIRAIFLVNPQSSEQIYIYIFSIVISRILIQIKHNFCYIFVSTFYYGILNLYVSIFFYFCLPFENFVLEHNKRKTVDKEILHHSQMG